VRHQVIGDGSLDRALEARFGSAVRGELAQKLVERTWRQAAGRFAVASQPELVEQTELSPNSAFRFTINVEVRPSVELQGYKGITVGYTAPVVTEADVDRSVNQRLQGKARLADVTDRAVQSGKAEQACTELMAENLSRARNNFGSSADNMSCIVLYLVPRQAAS
jgi:hypothetical protein